MPLPRIVALIGQSRQTMEWTQKQLAESLGTSLRTVARYERGQAHFDAEAVKTLATHVYTEDTELAAELAASIGQTLVSLGIEAPPPPPVHVAPAPSPAPPAPPPPPPPRPSALRDLIDAVVCSVADETNVVPKLVRPTVLLTLRRALEVGVDLEAALKAGVLGAEGASDTT